MEKLIDKYAQKLVSSGLAEEGFPLIGELDDELIWNRKDPLCGLLREVIEGLNINSLLFCVPAEPYRSIINYLANQVDQAIYPMDCETRTFLHDLPIIKKLDVSLIIENLKKRKSVIIRDIGVITFGTVSPEQTYITFSSVCFACFVKFYSDYLSDSKKFKINQEQRAVFEKSLPFLDEIPENLPLLAEGPFVNKEDVLHAISEVGRMTVNCRLVDSFFGNVSFRWKGTIYISQTGSSLDELNGQIDPIPIDGSSCSGITSSSELSAHRKILEIDENNVVLHGHPKFSVIISMDCDEICLNWIGKCHISCPKKRFVNDIPIVSGEVGTGKYGLCNTLPSAIKRHRGAIVYGHGLFTTGKNDFRLAFKNLIEIERMCKNEFFKRLVKEV